MRLPGRYISLSKPNCFLGFPAEKFCSSKIYLKLASRVMPNHYGSNQGLK